MEANKIMVVGAGSLGSFTTLHIAEMAGFLPYRLSVCDHDKVERHNLFNQLYRESDIGRYKVDALLDIIRYLTGIMIKPHPFKVGRPPLWADLHGIVIVLVDNMEARKEIFESCMNQADIPFYIEARSGLEGALVYAFDPRDPDFTERYQKTLYTTESAIQAPCAEQRTIPTLWLVAATICRILAQFTEAKIPPHVFTREIINTENLPILSPTSYNY